MSTFTEVIKLIKDSLKESITKDSTKEQIEKIAELDKSIDNLSEIHNKTEQDLSELKTDYIEVVKNSGFKTNGKEETAIDPDGEISFEDCIKQATKQGD